MVALSVSSIGQTNWGLRGNVGVEKKISKGFDAELEAQYRQTNNFRSTDRWSVGASLGKRVYRNKAKNFSVKAGIGYKYMRVYNDWKAKYKGLDPIIVIDGDSIIVSDGMEPQYYINNQMSFSLYDSYKNSRHRIYGSLQGSLELDRFKISLREMVQYTYIGSASYQVTKYRVGSEYKADDYDDDDDDDPKDWTNKEYTKIGGTDYFYKNGIKNKAVSHNFVLRSRINMAYDIPHWKYDPFVSFELFNGLGDGLKVEKSRLTVGFDFSFKKKHNFEVAYMWQNQHDDDEPAGSFICLGYKYEF